MNYPVWDLHAFGGGFWIAFIAVVHVFVSHFVFGWATEWVCFVGEIVALFIYYYTFGKMRAREHQIIGWFYFVFAWLSLFLINGIIGFMLTPGAWLDTQNFWHGFFNPSFWPSLFFRTFLSLMIAGMFGFITAVYQKNGGFRERIVRWSALWVLAPFVLMALSAWWYLMALPAPQQAMIRRQALEIAPYLRAFLWLTPALLVATLVMALRAPWSLRRPVAWLVLLIGFLHMGSFEFIREAGRRPYVIHGVMYSNAIAPEQMEDIDAQGYLATAKWTQFEQITDANELAAGEEIFRGQCSACHSRGGMLNDILPLTEGLPLLGVETLLAGQGTVVPYMPPFAGTADERRAVARYITEGLHGRVELDQRRPGRGLTVEIPPFDADTAEYALLAWNNLGMHCLSDSDPFFVILPPANEIQAQLIRRGETPEVVTEGVTLSYTVEEGFDDPAAHVKFWDFEDKNFGVDLERNVGLKGKAINGQLDLHEERGIFEAAMVPVVPYQGEHYNPYPLYTIEARDAESGELLAMTKTVVPTSSEMGCRKCHGGTWKVDGVAGFSDETSAAILAVHDKRNGTNLLDEALKGEPRLCASCHQDPATGTEGLPELLNLPAAMHGWHANYLTGRGAEACAFCHPADPAGATMCLRGGHSRNLDCTNCHGALEDHALGLLVAERDKGKPGAERLMAHLSPRAVDSLDDVVGRTPWLQEPDCLACHEDFERPDPETASAVYQWVDGPEGLYRFTQDDSGMLPCLACHGSPHATYPAYNDMYGQDRDNIQPLQYQGTRRPIGAAGGCTVCHIEEMEGSIHHDNMENP